MMTIENVELEEAKKYVDNMYREKMNKQVVKEEGKTIICLGEKVEFTDLELASVRLLREVASLNNIINELEKSIDNKLKEFEDNKDYFIDETTLKDLKNELQELKGSDKE